MSQVLSPCTGVCRIEPATELCSGCMRTLDEIADWPMLCDHDRRKLLALLDKRRPRLT
ncbi:MAG: DUF1289 domain-containing protein [Pseudomonadota bacterium]